MGKVDSTSKKILINKTSDQLRVALVEGQKLYDLEIEHTGAKQLVDGIYNAETISVEPSLEAAFVDFGSKKNGFLPLKEIASEYYSSEQLQERRQLGIKDILFEGQKILVQVNKEERGTKGAALSTYISLAGCYLVLMPNNPKASGISRRIEGEDREALRDLLAQLKIPKGMGVIVRTAGIGKSTEELQWDLDVLVQLWESIKQISQTHGAPYFIHQESDASTRAIRDHFRQDIDEVLIDDEETYQKIHAFVERVWPNFVNRIKLYTDPVPLFSRHQIEEQIESVFQRKVRLPSGGEIAIDHSEALIAIDVNSAQATKGEHIEETALNTNLEAAQEIARQLRIRDLGGLFVIDFIDMEEDYNNRKVEECLRNAVNVDRARVQIFNISRLGLLEMSRQRLRSSLSEASQVVCPRCHGQGSIRNIKSEALAILRLIEETALKENTRQIQVQVPINIATLLINEQRHAIQNIEKLHQITVIILPNPYMETPQYEVQISGPNNEISHKGKTLSYELIRAPMIQYQLPDATATKTVTRQEPAIKEFLPPIPAPKVKDKKIISKDFFKKLLITLFGEKKKPKEKFYKQRSGRYQKSYHSRHDSKRRSARNSNYQQRRRGGSDYRDRSERSGGGYRDRNERSGGGRSRDRSERGGGSYRERSSDSTRQRSTRQSSTRSTPRSAPPTQPAKKPVEKTERVEAKPVVKTETPKPIATPKHIKTTPSQPPADLMQVETRKKD